MGLAYLATTIGGGSIVSGSRDNGFSSCAYRSQITTMITNRYDAKRIFHSPHAPPPSAAVDDDQTSARNEFRYHVIVIFASLRLEPMLRA